MTPLRVPAGGVLGDQGFKGLLGRGGLGDPARRTNAPAEGAAVDGHLDPEGLLMVGPRGVQDPIVGPLPRRLLGPFLESALGALEVRDRREALELGGRERQEPVARGFVPEVKVERAAQRLECGCKQGCAFPATAARLALAEEKLLSERDPRGESGQPHSRDDRSTARRKQALVVEGVAQVHGLADGQVHDRIAEELEALVVGRCRVGVFVQVAAVDQRLVEETRIPEVEAEAARERGGRAHETRIDRSARTRWRARRCTRPRPGPCGSSRHPRPRSPSRIPLRDS